MRSSWKYYYESVNGIIFVIDSALKQEQLLDVRETLHQVLIETKELKVPLLIVANK